jgi:predicted esterase
MYKSEYLAYYTNKVEFDEAVATTSDDIDEYGPFDGVLAFSQGCHLAAALITANSDHQTTCSRFGFGVFMGASPFPILECTEAKNPALLDLPILHVMGRGDEHQHHSRQYANMHRHVSDSIVLEHDGGHHVPSDMAVIYSITRFMKTRMEVVIGVA